MASSFASSSINSLLTAAEPQQSSSLPHTTHHSQFFISARPLRSAYFSHVGTTISARQPRIGLTVVGRRDGRQAGCEGRFSRLALIGSRLTPRRSSARKAADGFIETLPIADSETMFRFSSSGYLLPPESPPEDGHESVPSQPSDESKFERSSSSNGSELASEPSTAEAPEPMASESATLSDVPPQHQGTPGHDPILSAVGEQFAAGDVGNGMESALKQVDEELKSALTSALESPSIPATSPPESAPQSALAEPNSGQSEATSPDSFPQPSSADLPQPSDPSSDASNSSADSGTSTGAEQVHRDGQVGSSSHPQGSDGAAGSRSTLYSRGKTRSTGKVGTSPMLSPSERWEKGKGVVSKPLFSRSPPPKDTSERWVQPKVGWSPTRSSTKEFVKEIDLEAEYFEAKEGDDVVGVVVQSTPQWCLVDIGAKHYAHLHFKEWGPFIRFPATAKEADKWTHSLSPASGPVPTRVSKYIRDEYDPEDLFVKEKVVTSSGVMTPSGVLPPVGTVLHCLVLAVLTSGVPQLSMRKHANQYSWRRVAQLYAEGEPLDVAIVDLNKGGAITYVEGRRAFLPVGYILNGSGGEHPDIKAMVGGSLKVCVREIDEKAGRLIVSQHDAKSYEERKWLKKGALVHGTVVRRLEFGVMVRIDNCLVRGLIHISNTSYLRVDHLEDVFPIGDRVKAVIISAQGGKIALSTKELEAEDGLMLENRERVYAEAETMAENYRQQMDPEEEDEDEVEADESVLAKMQLSETPRPANAEWLMEIDQIE